MTRSGVRRWIARSEAWLPPAIGSAWWLAMYPGLFGEDSLINLTEAVRGPISGWFTAWWIYVVRLVTIGGRAIPLLTLAEVIVLTIAIRTWARACFRQHATRSLALCVICATPLVGALGIQIRHDIPMTAGLLLFAAVLTRSTAGSLHGIDYAQLAGAALLVATRHNGLPTVLGATVLGLPLQAIGSRARWTAAGLAVAACVFAATQLSTRAAGISRSVEPLQSVEWTLGDISCLLSHPDVRVSPENWRALGQVASPADWPQASACRFIDNGLLFAPSFRRSVVDDDPAGVVRVWLSLAVANPVRMIQAHAERVRLFLPPFLTGMPSNDSMPFIHSTILPNDFGLAWALPRVAEAARLPVRAWNASRLFAANAGLWLLVLGALAWRSRRDAAVHLLPTLLVAVALELGILATAPISEGRYGLLILVCGQTVTLVALFERWHQWIHPSEQRSVLPLGASEPVSRAS